MNTRLRNLSMAVGIALMPISNATSVDMKSFFDSYSQGSTGKYSTAQGTYWHGGSFTGRIEQVNSKFVRFSPPSVQAGCRGIDMFAGSFGLISGDELVQMARGVAQGSSMYFFGMAIKSICATCGAEMDKMLAKLESWNRFAKNSCQQMVNWASNQNTGLLGRLNNSVKSRGAMDDVLSGFVDEFPDFESVTRKSGASAGNLSYATASKFINKNMVFHSLNSRYSNINMSALGLDGVSLIELIQSLYGTVITAANTSAECTSKGSEQACLEVNAITPTLSFDTLLNGTQSDEMNRLLQCDDDVDCLNPGGSSNQGTTLGSEYEGLVTVFKKLVHDGANGGIINKIHSKATLSSDEIEFNKLFNYPYAAIAKELNYNSTEDVASVIAMQSAMTLLKRMHSDFSSTLKMATLISGGSTKTDSKQEMKELIEAGDKRTDEYFEQLRKRIEDRKTFLAIVSTIKDISRQRGAS